MHCKDRMRKKATLPRDNQAMDNKAYDGTTCSEGLDWQQARQWMINGGIIPPAHLVTKPDACLANFMRTLQNGVFLCQLLLKLKPNCLSDGDWNPQPQMRFQYLKNVTAFLETCCSEFQFTEADMFSEDDLYDVDRFQKVLQFLFKLSVTEEAHELGWRHFNNDINPSLDCSEVTVVFGSDSHHNSIAGQAIFVTLEQLMEEQLIEERAQWKLENVFSLSSSLSLPSAPEDIDKYPWYVGKMSRLEAEQILHQMRDGVFLVRERANEKPGEYALSVRRKGQTMHFKVNRTNGTLMFYVTEQHKFISVKRLVTFYQNEPLGDIKLSFPIHDETVNSKAPTKSYSQPGCSAEVISTFLKTHEYELTIEKHDQVKILTKDTRKRGWWYGKCKGKTGIFPSHCVSEVQNEETVSKDIDEEERHLIAFETTLEKKGCLEQTIIHCLFFGQPRGGKSSLIKRLTGHPPNPNITSTGVVEKTIQVEVRKLTTSTVMAIISDWHVLTFDDEAIALMVTATQKLTMIKASSLQAPPEPCTTAEITPPGSDETTPTSSGKTTLLTPEGSVHSPSSAEANASNESGANSAVPQRVTSAKLPEDYVPPMEVLKQAIKRRGLDEVELYLQGSLTLYLTDTGGQMEFQELLPALVAGPSVFFVVFRLDQDLNKTFMIEYLHPNGQSAEPYQSSFSVKETLFQSLASIASMGTHVYSKKLKKQVPLKPKVVLVGTHKDRVSLKKIAQIDNELQQMVKATTPYRDGLIEFASETQLVVTVNNLSPDDSDFQVIRSVVERIAERGDFKLSSPSTWLIFSLIIRQLKSRVITYAECFSITQKCGIDSHDELNDALRFLNLKVGLVRHFKGEGLEELEEIVIIDPQILFDKITKLIIGTFTFQKVAASVLEEFKRKGIFSLSVLEQLSSLDDEDQLLTVSRLVKLLEHLHIIARLHSDTDHEEVKYFMPCTLAHAESTAPVLARPQSRFDFKKLFLRSHKGKPKPAPPLLVTFECGYCPKGLFSALAVYLLANKMQSCLVWKLQTNCIFKNSISLSVGPYDTMTLTLAPTYLEVSVVPADIEQDRKFPIEKTCTEVQQCISKAVREVTSSLNYTSDAEHTLAFYCPGNHEGVEDQHPAKIQFHNGKPCSVWCETVEETLTYDLPNNYQHWFVETPSTGRRFNPLDYLIQMPNSYTVDIDNEALDSQHLLEITDYLHDLEKTDLYNLGLVLGLRRHRITDLRERCSCLEFCDCIVDCWLQRVDDVEAMNMIPSWRNLVLALKHPRVGQTGLADRVAKERPVPI